LVILTSVLWRIGAARVETRGSLETTMFIGRVTGSLVASQKIKSVVGKKLLLVDVYNAKTGERSELVSTGRSAVVIDTVGAGEGDLVLVTQGSSARLTDMTSDVPTDAVIVGIVDAIQMGHEEVYKKQA
jgi:ethanolamine utilization protein EutN